MSNEINALKLDKNMTVETVDENGLIWLNPDQPPFKLIGFYWFEQDKVYRRFPVNPDPVLPEAVDALSNCTAGGQIKFKTDSKRIAVKVKLPSPPAMDHMPDTGSSGFDIYAGQPGRQTFCGVIRLVPRSADYTHEFVFPENIMREVTLNFPLYNGVEKLSVGLDADAAIAAPAPFANDSPIVVYGTSIAQGGCASRPSMCYSNILSRKLNRPFINLGFSGNGKGEPEVAEHISRIKNPAMFILDYEANVSPERMAETLSGFIHILRKKHPVTPILVVSKVAYAREVFDEEPRKQREISKKIEHDNVEKLRADGDQNIHFIDAESFQGEDFWECTVDGVHPTDLGFYRMAENLLPEIEKRL